MTNQLDVLGVNYRRRDFRAGQGIHATDLGKTLWETVWS